MVIMLIIINNDKYQIVSANCIRCLVQMMLWFTLAEFHLTLWPILVRRVPILGSMGSSSAIQATDKSPAMQTTDQLNRNHQFLFSLQAHWLTSQLQMQNKFTKTNRKPQATTPTPTKAKTTTPRLRENTRNPKLREPAKIQARPRFGTIPFRECRTSSAYLAALIRLNLPEITNWDTSNWTDNASIN